MLGPGQWFFLIDIRHIWANPLAFFLDKRICGLHALEIPDFWGYGWRAKGSRTHDEGDHHGS